MSEKSRWKVFKRWRATYRPLARLMAEGAEERFVLSKSAGRLRCFDIMSTLFVQPMSRWTCSHVFSIYKITLS